MASVEFIRFKKLLRKNNYFVTAPRMRLFGILQKHPALTFKELTKLFQKHDQVTLYRNIDLFESLGIINRLRLGWHTKVELSDVFRHHHHHMSCVSCGKVLVLKDSALVESEINRIGKRAGFQALDHQLEIRGLCSKCQKNIEAQVHYRSLGKPHTSVKPS